MLLLETVCNKSEFPTDVKERVITIVFILVAALKEL